MRTWDRDVENARMGKSKMEHLWLNLIRGMSVWGPAVHGNIELRKSAQAPPQVTLWAQERAQNAALLIVPSHLLQAHHSQGGGIQFGVRPSFLMGG